MKLTLTFILGALVSTAFHYDRIAVAEQPDMVLVHYETDVCGYDDIGLMRLNENMIEEKLKD